MSRMTSKGQVTIPKRIRDRLGLVPGASVEFRDEGEGRIVLCAKHDADGTTRVEQERRRFEAALAALHGSAGPGLSTDELMRLTRGWGEPDREDK